MDLSRLFDRTLNIVLRGVPCEEDIDRERSPGDREGRDIAKEPGKLVCVHCCRGNDELEVIATRNNLSNERERL